MPLIYRSMILKGDRPKVGPTARTLGARIPGDLEEVEGLVLPLTGGMSVSRSWRELPPWRILIRLIHLEPKAAGKSDLYCWRMGEGPFIESDLAVGLKLRPEDATHALVEPSDPMTAEKYQSMLDATSDLWRIDED